MAVSAITELLAQWGDGVEVHGRIIPLIYADLRRIAASLFVKERKEHTLPPTAVVTEAYLRLQNGGPWQSRAHFFGAAAHAMRQTLVDYARRRSASKRGGYWERVGWEEADLVAAAECAEILSVDEALDRLALLYPRWAEVIRLRYFAGLSVQEAADVIGVSVATVKNDWSKAKTWLKGAL